jgi:hypothetical protein
MVRPPRKRKRGFLLGTLVGLIAGAMGGTALLRRGAEVDRPFPVAWINPPSTATGARDAARHALTAAHEARDEGAARAYSAFDTLRERWRLAMREGRKAALERQRELEAQLAFERKEIPPLEAQLIEAVERRFDERQQPAIPSRTVPPAVSTTKGDA